MRPDTLHVVPGAFDFRPVEGSWLVQGKVTWKTPPVDDGWFAIAVIDKRVSLKPPKITAVTPDGAHVQGGSDRVLNRVAELHPWLRGAGDIHTGDNNWHSGGRALSLSSMVGGVTFVAEFPKMKVDDPARAFYAAGPIALQDVVVGLVFIGNDRQVYWAQRLF